MTVGIENERYFSRAEAAKYLHSTFRIRCTTKTLANYASRRVGPPFHYSGRHPVYRKRELDEWAHLHLGPLTAGPRMRRAENEGV
jgi:hypothetical protein